jgi:hypothetical protein
MNYYAHGRRTADVQSGGRCVASDHLLKLMTAPQFNQPAAIHPHRISNHTRLASGKRRAANDTCESEPCRPDSFRKAAGLGRILSLPRCVQSSAAAPRQRVCPRGLGIRYQCALSGVRGARCHLEIRNPEKIQFVDRLAKTSVGKIDKKLLREAYAADPSATTSRMTDTTSVECGADQDALRDISCPAGKRVSSKHCRRGFTVTIRLAFAGSSASRKVRDHSVWLT